MPIDRAIAIRHNAIASDPITRLIKRGTGASLSVRRSYIIQPLRCFRLRSVTGLALRESERATPAEQFERLKAGGRRLRHPVRRALLYLCSPAAPRLVSRGRG